VFRDNLAAGGRAGFDVELEQPGVTAAIRSTAILNRGRLEHRHQTLAIRGAGEALEPAVVSAPGHRGGGTGKIQGTRRRARQKRRGRQQGFLEFAGCVEPVECRTILVAHPKPAVREQDDPLGVKGPSATADGGGR